MWVIENVEKENPEYVTPTEEEFDSICKLPISQLQIDFNEIKKGIGFVERAIKSKAPLDAEDAIDSVLGEQCAIIKTKF